MASQRSLCKVELSQYEKIRANVEKDIKHENEVNPTVNYKVSQIKFLESLHRS